MKLSTILDHIDLGQMALPEFQRGYVWNREQVRGLMESLYRRHPVGSLLVWTTSTEGAVTRGDASPAPGFVKLLLDGQQRVTSLYGIIRGRAPEFFDGNEQAFLDLYFNVEDESFEFYGPIKMKDNPGWVSVTQVMQEGVAPFIEPFSSRGEGGSDLGVILARINQIESIKEREFHVEEVSGGDKTVDVVVDIFNRVNSGGTKLSKGDLALAKICADWPEARKQMKDLLAKWERFGFSFRLEWLLRCVNTYVTGEALFTALKDTTTDQIRDGLVNVETYIDNLINLIASRLGLDHDRVLGSRYSFATMVPLLKKHGGNLPDPKERDRLLYWYIHTFLWGRYTGSTESVINQDLEVLEEPNPIDALIERLRQNRGDLRITPNDFLAWSRGARFYPLLYMLTRVWRAKDWETGVELQNHLLGSLSQLQMHHIFPKALLYQHEYEKRDVNALANFTFLTKATNLKVSDKDPAEYLAEYADRDPSLLESHWIPLEPALWKLENYPDFLARRRELLAQAANDFLDHLLHGTVPEVEIRPFSEIAEAAASPSLPGSIDSEEEEQELLACSDWVEEQGYTAGELLYELVDTETDEPLALVDLAWPNGLQEGLSEPVALLLNEDKETEEIVNKAGFRFFTSVAGFKEYVTETLSVVGEV